MVPAAVSSKTPQERSKQWHRDNARRKLMVYFKSEAEREKMQAMAEADGYKRFSRWILDKALIGGSGNVEDARVSEALRERIEQLEEQVEYERSKANEYRDRAAALTVEIQNYARKFADLSAKLVKERK